MSRSSSSALVLLCPSPPPRGRVREGASAAKVSFHDPLVPENGFRRPFRELFSVVEDENLFAEIHDDLHVVLHDQDSFAAGAEIADGAQEIGEQTSINTGGGLIQKNQVLVNHQDPGKLQKSLLAVGKIAGKFAAEPVELDEGQKLQRPAVGGFPILPGDDEEIF